jgi:hypothetical protein
LSKFLKARLPISFFIFFDFFFAEAVFEFIFGNNGEREKPHSSLDRFFFGWGKRVLIHEGLQDGKGLGIFHSRDSLRDLEKKSKSNFTHTEDTRELAQQNCLDYTWGKI